VVLSKLFFERVLDTAGRAMALPGMSLPLEGQRIMQGGGWRIEDNVMHHTSYLEFIPGPYVLEPDEVITMRLRARPFVDWSETWTIERLREMALTLRQPIGGVEVRLRYRQGQRLVDQIFRITGLTVLQQPLYAERLRTLTGDFTDRPQVQERAITD